MTICFPHELRLFPGELNSRLKALKNADGRMAFYLGAYPHLVSIAAKLDASLLESDVVLAHIGYGWMPTALSQIEQWSQTDQADTLLGRLKSLDSLCATEFVQQRASPPVNNSWVGTSKFLHFARPDLFPIWDRRIAVTFGAKHRYELEKPGIYARYLAAMRRWIDHNPQLPSAVANVIGYNVEPMRALELLLFVRGQD